MADAKPSKIIQLTRGMTAIVDADDYPILCQRRWWAAKSKIKFYAMGYVDGRQIQMHRFLLDPPPGMVVDHINGNTLDNRRANLRIATLRPNNANSKSRSGAYKGVRRDKRTGKWFVQITIGTFESEREAAEVYDRYALELHGEFCRKNLS